MWIHFNATCDNTVAVVIAYVIILIINSVCYCKGLSIWDEGIGNFMIKCVVAKSPAGDYCKHLERKV